MDRKDRNSPMNKFLIPLFKIYLLVFIGEATNKWIISPLEFTRETGLDWITSATSCQVDWIKCILNIPG